MASSTFTLAETRTCPAKAPSVVPEIGQLEGRNAEAGEGGSHPSEECIGIRVVRGGIDHMQIPLGGTPCSSR
jgi:hypothetical protein